MTGEEMKEIRETLGSMAKAIQDIRTAINGNDLGTPGLAHELRRHGADDARQFGEIRLANDQMKLQQDRIAMQIAKWGGAISALIFLIGIGAALFGAWH